MKLTEFFKLKVCIKAIKIIFFKFKDAITFLGFIIRVTHNLGLVTFRIPMRIKSFSDVVMA